MARRWLPLASVLALAALVGAPATRAICAMACVRPAAAAAAPAAAAHHGPAHAHHAPAVASDRATQGLAWAPVQGICAPPDATLATASLRPPSGDGWAALALAVVSASGPRQVPRPAARRAPPPVPTRAPLPLRI